MPDESDRVSVNTYVPMTQRERWREDAETLGMSQSEFVRSMVQAGRRGFSLGESTSDPTEPGLPGSSPRGDGLKTAVLELLRSEGRLGWSELVDELTGGLEEDLEAALTELTDENAIEHSPRRGDYGISEGPDGQ